MYPWERQPKEGPEAYEAFICYRDLEPESRTLANTAAELGKSGTLISRWSAQWGWVQRVAAWEDNKLRVADEAQIEAIRDTNKTIHDGCVSVRNKVIQALNNIDYAQLSVDELVTVFDIINKHDRAALGMDAGNVRGSGMGSGKRGGGVAPNIKLYQGIDLAKI